ncbi:helix-turn-helix domain-containing protein [Brevibacillus marinus]|uniref:helix-turn-helix domain-containing protein n=1 Tax=Brevibacillus marinus TaxID=2496837 RepID=UPI000F8226A1|nr:helix-turn-helix transcriptional regulator [Brevibacillus marinus]
MKSLGLMLRSAREKKGLIQKEAAAKAGISNVTLSQYENDVRTPDPLTLAKLADIYEVSVDFLLGRSDNKAKIAGDYLLVCTDDPNGYGSKSLPTEKPDLKQLLETQPLRYDGAELSPEEQELIAAHVRMAYELIKKSGKIRAGQRKKNRPGEE